MLDKGYLTQWIGAAGVRAIKTVAQTMIASIGTAIMLSDVDWKVSLSTATLAGLLSLLTSIYGLPELKMPNQPDQETLNNKDETKLHN